jgi:ABC-type lipoprotein release transport system permease subunit
MGSNVSSVAIIVEKEANREKITKELMSKGLFTTIQDVKKTKESIEKVIQGLQELMYLIAFAGVITLFVFSLNVIVLDIIERENEFVNLRTGGATLWTIAKIIGLQILIITVAVLILQGPIGYYSTEWINQEVIAKVFYVTTYLKPITYVITSVSLIIGLGAGVLISIRHAMKISLLLITRIRFQT